MARLAEVGFTLVLTLIFVRALGPQLYGEYAFIVSAASLGAIILSFGQSETLGRFVADFVAKGATPQLRYLMRVFVAVRLSGLAVGSLALALWHQQLAAALNLPLLADYWLPVAALLAGQVVIELATSYAYARLRSRSVAVARTAGQVLAIVLFAALALSGWRDPVSATLAVVASYLLTTLILLLGGMAKLLIQGQGAPFNLRPVVSFSLGAWGANIFTMGLAGQIDVLLLSGFGKGATEIALYSVATLVFVKLGVLLSGWSSTAVPSFAETLARNGLEEVKALFGVYVRVHLLLAMLVYPPVALLSSQIVTYAFGAGYAGAADLMALYGGFWIASSFLFSGISLALLFALNCQREALIVRVIAGMLNILLDVLLIPPLGALGAIIATGTANALASLGDFVVAARRLHGVYPWGFALRIGAAALAAAAPALLLQPGNLVAVAFVLVLYYLVFMVIVFASKPFGVLDAEQVERLIPRSAWLVAKLTSVTQSRAR